MAATQQTRAVAVSLLALLVLAPLASAQQTPPPPLPTLAKAPAPAQASTQPPPASHPPPPTAPPPTATPPKASPPTVAATPPTVAATPPKAAATPPTNSVIATKPLAPAPSTTKPLVIPAAPPSGAVVPPAATPTKSAVAPATATTPTKSAVAPTSNTGTKVAPAPGPTSAPTTVTADIGITTNGALTTDQQAQVCQAVIGKLQSSNFPQINKCAVTGQSASAPATFATSGRRLQQNGIPFTLTLSLSSATPAQLPAIQAALNTLTLSIGTQSTPVVVININIIVGPAPSTPSAPLPPNTPTLPAGTKITPAAPAPGGGAPAPANTVITAVPPDATGTTKTNVKPADATPTTVPQGATTTTTTVTNTTTTTQIITISIYLPNTGQTSIQQFVFTIAIGGSTGTLVTITFTLPGNVATNLPTVVTGGAPTGQKANLQVAGPTITIITSTAITTTSTTTTTTTPTNTGTTTPATTTTPTTPGTALPPATNTGGIVPGKTTQICQVPNNPYGIVQITENAGTLKKGAFIVSSWNDVANNNPGQGNIIYQCQPDGTSTIWATVSATGACAADNAGVGVTMALTKCGDTIIVGSTPINPGETTAHPGCLIALDTSGNQLAQVSGNGINGPWGSACSTSGGQITLAVSNVLGGPSATTTTGRRLLAPAPAPGGASVGGTITRYTFAAPTKDSWTLGNPTVLATNIPTMPAGIAGGTVGPGGLTTDDQGNLYAPNLMDNTILKIANWLTTTNGAPTLLSLPANNGINMPNSVFFFGGKLIGANAGDGNIFTITLDTARNAGTVSTTLADPQNTAGVLFQVVISVVEVAGAPVGSVWFVHDGTSTLNTFSTAQAPAPGHILLAPAPSKAST